MSVRAEAGSQAFLLSNPFDLELMDRLARQVGQGGPLSFFITDPETLSALLHGLTDAAGATTEHMSEEDLHAAILSSNPEGEVELSPEDEYEVLSPEQMARKGKLPPVVRFVNMILSEGVKRGASDIHIEPQEDGLQVRYRIDGILIDATKAPKHFQPMAISRFKIIAKRDIAERRKPQDGRSRLKMGDKKTDLRISVLPTQHGEKVVVRLLAGDSSTVSMDRLGLDPEPLRIFQRMLNSPQGMILVTGPTGSGKTTTLYTALNYVKSPTKNIITLENPVEIQIAGISQVEVNPKGGMTFATGLRSILRQDPDIVLVGEIRDQETATIALEASQTGHLLLSTLHTNNAAATITRLLDLGIEPYQVSSSVIGIVAQRLVRRLCSACAVERTPSPATAEQLGGASNLPENVRWLSAAGCDLCEGAGYKGRLAIVELLDVTEKIRDLINKQAPDVSIREEARRNGMRTMLEDGLAKAAAGYTTLEEVARVVPTYAASPSSPSSLPDQDAPLSEAVPNSPSGSPLPPAHAVEGTPEQSAIPRLLIIDDQEDIQDYLRIVLSGQGYEVSVAADGIDALAQLASKRFDLILSDLNMPNLDGIKLLKLIQQNKIQTPVIVLTGEGNDEREQQCLELGATDYIRKPIKKDPLLLRIKRTLN